MDEHVEECLKYVEESLDAKQFMEHELVRRFLADTKEIGDRVRKRWERSDPTNIKEQVALHIELRVADAFPSFLRFVLELGVNAEEYLLSLEKGVSSE